MKEKWEEFKKTGCPELKKELIEHYAYLVKFVAGRIKIKLPDSIELDDLISFGVFGLIDAIDKYNPVFKVKFDTYAKTRIGGSIYDAIRKLDWAPRSVRRNRKLLEKAYRDLEQKLGRSVSDDEVAKELNLSENEMDKYLNDARKSLVLSLEEFLYQSEGSDMDKMKFLKDEQLNSNPSYQVHVGEIRKVIKDAINELTNSEKLVVILYYYNELTLKEIAVSMELTESRISQLHTKAILKLRSKLSDLKRELLNREIE